TTLESRKTLEVFVPGIHFFPGVLPVDVHVVQTLHQLSKLPDTIVGPEVISHPSTKQFVDGRIFLASLFANLFDNAFVVAQCDVLHGSSVHETRVHYPRGPSAN